MHKLPWMHLGTLGWTVTVTQVKLCLFIFSTCLLSKRDKREMDDNQNVQTK